ncbi:hypothetical protein [Paracoccus sp. SM22M-07]|uniref:hypothetical protein n=1 Tax=Paracoccus sp. SM22M-07 TaxID=1520813 RepID=UPI000915643F|nr:hypothetical protein [Paracoccus sp. SM22M-07]OJH43997.1 hypothetical protein IE00_12370 [Paracoccus sp. SM22M-07]
MYPNLSEDFRLKVTELADTLSDPEIRTRALEIILGLIEAVTVRATPAGIILELEGALAAMIGLAQGGTQKASRAGG